MAVHPALVPAPEPDLPVVLDDHPSRPPHEVPARQPFAVLDNVRVALRPRDPAEYQQGPRPGLPGRLRPGIEQGQGQPGGGDAPPPSAPGHHRPHVCRRRQSSAEQRVAHRGRRGEDAVDLGKLVAVQRQCRGNGKAGDDAASFGRAIGGDDIGAMRGHASIQGSTDVPTLYDLLPGYLQMPKARKGELTLESYLDTGGQSRGWWSRTACGLASRFPVVGQRIAPMMRTFIARARSMPHPMRFTWSRQEVEFRLQQIMKNIHTACVETSERFGHPGNYVMGANIAGFLKVANSMLDQGLV